MSSHQNGVVAAAAAAPVVVGEGNQQAQNQFQLWPFLKSMVVRMVMFWMISSLIRNFFGPKQQPGTQNSSLTPGGGAKTYPPSFNLFTPDQHFNFYMYLSAKSDRFHDFDNIESLIWLERDLVYGDWESGADRDGSRVKSIIQMPTPEVLQRNGSLYLHMFLVKRGQSHLPRATNYGGREVVYSSYQLNRYKKKYYRKTANLLTGKTEQSAVEQQKAEEGVKYEVLNYWHPNITVNLVTDFSTWTRGQLPAPLDEAVKFDPASNRYYPIVFFNNYWNLATEYQPVNETVTSLNLTITFAPLSLFKWQLYASQQMRGKWSQMLGGEMFEESDADQDAIKQALIETSPVLLGVTILVSILHTVLELLAFKNDIQFWRTRKSLEGLSVRSVLFNIFQSFWRNLKSTILLSQRLFNSVTSTNFLRLCFVIFLLMTPTGGSGPESPESTSGMCPRSKPPKLSCRPLTPDEHEDFYIATPISTYLGQLNDALIRLEDKMDNNWTAYIGFSTMVVVAFGSMAIAVAAIVFTIRAPTMPKMPAVMHACGGIQHE